jgi:hypothetical protein
MDKYAHSIQLNTKTHTYELGISDHAILEFSWDFSDVLK